jgi:zinc transporter 5/7
MPLALQDGTPGSCAETPAIVLSNHNENPEHIHSTTAQRQPLLFMPVDQVKATSPPDAAGGQSSPLTPRYTFGYDDHIQQHGSGHTPNLQHHSHGHFHEGHSHNMRGVFLHVMADTLGSVGVILSTLLIQFYGWSGFDPIASLLIAILIAASVIPLVLDTGRILCLDVGGKDIVIHQAISELSSIEGLASHSVPRFWPKDSSSLVGSILIQLAPSSASLDPAGPHSNQRTTYTRIDRVVERVDTVLRRNIAGLEELTIQVEGQY